MTLKNRLNNAISALLPNNAIYAEYYKRGGGNKADWKRQANMLNAKEIKDWKLGVMSATNPENPRRGDLMRFYQALMLDNHLASVIDTRILRVQRSSFRLTNDKDEENYELKALLERPWFEDLVRLVLMSRFQGATLIEMFDVDAETQELARVDEIPQSNFIAQKGLIIKEEYDDKGVDFRTGAYSDYYLQVGSDWDLGMLNQLAMIVLAKKLGIGSWMSYVDKFGVPPIFVITDRMDTGRRDELFEMMSNFRQNMFSVLQGNERVEVPRITENNQHQVFLSLIDSVCNKEISKRILGGTASTDEQAYVGSAEVQERVAQDRYEADKLLFKYIFNTKIRPRLVKISSVYADFTNYTFEWDNQETLDINGYIDAVQKLSNTFEFDVEEVKTRTGLPIIGTKQFVIAGNDPQPPPEPADPQKKKPDAHLPLTHSTRGGTAPLSFGEGLGVRCANWDAAAEQLVNQIWSGNVSAAELNRDLVLKYYSGLNKATHNGWGGGYYTEDLTRQFRENLLRFSGAKSYNLIKELIAAKESEPVKEVYLDRAKTLLNTHNETWQQVEEKFAANSASSARDFQAYQKDADLYPNLKFRTMGDANVRPEHAANEGVIKPINEWTKIPPLDYGCRCWMEQTTENPNGRDITVYNDKIANNAATTGELFTGKNSYFQNVPKTDKQAVYGNTELMKKYMPYNRQVKVGDKTVHISDFADLRDLEDNIKAAKLLAKELDKDVYVRHHITPGNVKKEKNPELGIETPNKLYDLKTYRKVVDGKEVTPYNFVRNSIRTLNEQKASGVLDFSGYKGEKDNLRVEISKSLSENIRSRVNVKNVIVIFDNKTYQVGRKQILSNDYAKFME